MVDRWLECSRLPLDGEEVGSAGVVDASAIREAEPFAFVGLKDGAAVDGVDRVRAVDPCRLAFYDEGLQSLGDECGEEGEWSRWLRGFGAVVGIGLGLSLRVGWRDCHGWTAWRSEVDVVDRQRGRIESLNRVEELVEAGDS